MQFPLAGMKGYFSFERAFKIIHSNSNLHTFSSLMGLQLQIGRTIYRLPQTQGVMHFT